MKNINEIDLTKYCYYAFTDFINDFEIEFITPQGRIKLDSGYELFSINNGTIIAFETFATYGFHDCYLKQGSIEKHLDLVVYEDCVDAFDNKNLDKYNFYVFLKSSAIPINYGQVINKFEFTRCDTEKYGGMAFEQAPNPYLYTKVFNIINITGIGHIARIETSNSEIQNPYHHSLYSGTRTLSGMLKLIYEWAEVTKPPFNNNEEIAIHAKNFIENLDIYGSTLQEILAFQSDLQLAKYIKGVSFSPYELFEKFDEPDSLKNFVFNKCRYKSLSSLMNSNPNNPQIPLEILEQEKNICQESLYKFCFINGIDTDNSSLIDIINAIKSQIADIDSEYQINPLLAAERLFYK